MTSQEDLLKFAAEFCSCPPDSCDEEECNACAALDPYWTCPNDRPQADPPA